MATQQRNDGEVEKLGKSFSDPLVQIALVIDSLAFAVACQPGVNASQLARQLKREARLMKSRNDFAKALLEKMIRSVGSAQKKRTARRRAD